jgi:hypothetical protein
MFDQNASAADKLADLEWLVESRSRNQRSTLALYKLLLTHKKKLDRSRRQRAAAQMLLSSAFSLWRAVFLADIKQDRGALLQDIEGFLVELIQNNAITYVQDRKHRDWTFRYYVDNARARLKNLNRIFKELGFAFELPGESKGKTPQDWWLTHQTALEGAIEQFESILNPPKPPKPPKQKKRISN